MRKLRFIFSSLFIVLTCAFFNISASAAETVFNIETDADWLEMCNTVNSMTMSTSNTVTINILADIDLTQVSAYSTNCNIQSTFYGTVNGNNHIISNGKFSVDSSNYLGLFNNISNTTISNLVLYNCTYFSENSSVRCGAVVGYSVSSSFFNVYSVNNNFDITSAYYLSGVCAHAGSNTTFDLCFNFTDITVSSVHRISGICGAAGYYSVTFTRCANYGDLGVLSITGTTDYYINGICGATSHNVMFDYCYNLGNVYGYLCSGISATTTVSTMLKMTSCYSFIDSNGYDNLTMAYAPLYLSYYNDTLPNTFLRNYNFAYGLNGFNNTTKQFYSFVNVDLLKDDINQSIVDDLNNGYTVFQLDEDNINNGFPTFVESYNTLKTVILPLINGGGSGELLDNWVSLDGRAEGTFDSETGKFTYNISVNAPDYSGTLGNPNYTGSYTIPGEADDVGVDINDTSGFDNILSTDFSSLFEGLPFIFILFSLFIEPSFSLIIIFVLLFCLMFWFIGRKV